MQPGPKSKKWSVLWQLIIMKIELLRCWIFYISLLMDVSILMNTEVGIDQRFSLRSCLWYGPCVSFSHLKCSNDRNPVFVPEFHRLSTSRPTWRRPAYSSAYVSDEAAPSESWRSEYQIKAYNGVMLPLVTPVTWSCKLLILSACCACTFVNFVITSGERN